MPGVLLLVHEGDPMAVLYVVGTTVVGLVILASGASYLRAYGRVRRGRTDSIEAVEPGDTAFLEGTAQRATETLEAPFSGDDCLAYEYEVYETADASAADPVDEAQVATAFSLYDCGHTVRVMADDDGMELRLDDESDLAASGRTERLLRPGETVQVRGEVRTRDDADRFGAADLRVGPTVDGDGDDIFPNVSTSPMRELSRGLFARGVLALLVGVAFLGMAALMVLT